MDQNAAFLLFFVHKFFAAERQAGLCGFGLCFLWLWFPFRTQEAQTKATEGGLVFFSSSEVKNISTINVTVFDGSRFIWGRDPRLATWATSIPSSSTTFVFRIHLSESNGHLEGLR
jgi:hypothetical protein